MRLVVGAEVVVATLERREKLTVATMDMGVGEDVESMTL